MADKNLWDVNAQGAMPSAFNLGLPGTATQRKRKAHGYLKERFEDVGQQLRDFGASISPFEGAGARFLTRETAPTRIFPPELNIQPVKQSSPVGGSAPGVMMSGGQFTAKPAPSTIPASTVIAERRAATNPFFAGVEGTAQPGVNAPTMAIPEVPAAPEAGTKLPWNTLSYVLGQAASAVMGPFQDSPAALLGQKSAEFAQQRAQRTYVADILAGRAPDASVAALVSPETEMQALTMREGLEDARVQRTATVRQLDLDDRKVALDERKVTLQENEAGIGHAEFKASLAQEKSLNDLRNATMIKVAQIQNSDNRTGATRAVEEAMKVYTKTLSETFGDEEQALQAYNAALRAQGHPELIAVEAPVGAGTTAESELDTFMPKGK